MSLKLTKVHVNAIKTDTVSCVILKIKKLIKSFKKIEKVLFVKYVLFCNLTTLIYLPGFTKEDFEANAAIWYNHSDRINTWAVIARF